MSRFSCVFLTLHKVLDGWLKEKFNVKWAYFTLSGCLKNQFLEVPFMLKRLREQSRIRVAFKNIK
ncbi:MAG: hypothetical protein IJV35_00405 [Neisseriaceae bacterium]|nr:hypothetical protein [Neisseriaceae bacterium]